MGAYSSLGSKIGRVSVTTIVTVALPYSEISISQLTFKVIGCLCYAKSDKISKIQLYNSNPPIHYQDR